MGDASSTDRHARLTQLFAEALGLPAEDRLALLARVNEMEAGLATELAGLLEADARSDPNFVTGALAAATAPESPNADAASADTIGVPANAAGLAAATHPRRIEIPGFRLLEKLGEGGMGTVWAGEQDAPRRPVAIKVLHAHALGALRRFRAEAEIMARLDHPGIAKVLEAGEADGHPYFVMERIDGELLDVFARRAPVAARLSLFVGLCEAIHHAHVKGVFHRDLKPSNLMVREGGRVVVLDFGIARADATGAETHAGELIGTPVYMSPEQARLRPDEVDARSDVYTLGVILYELISNELPYPVRGRSLIEVARTICDEPPTPLGKLDRRWRGDLEAICDRALSKAPEHRYPSAAALGDDVRRYLEGATVTARVPGAIEQVRRFARRRPGIAAAIVGAIVTSALFAVVVTALYLEARDARARTDAERARVVMANRRLEERTNQLVLDQARTLVSRDPTAALAALSTLTPLRVDPAVAWAIADEARGRGAATDVRAAHADELRWVEATSDGYVTGGYDGVARRWVIGRPDPIELVRQPQRVHVVRVSPDGQRFAIGADAGRLAIVDPAGAAVTHVSDLTGEVEHVAWSPDGAWLAAGDDAGRMVIIAPAGGTSRTLVDTGAAIGAVAWSRDSTHLAIATATEVQLGEPSRGFVARAPIAHEAILLAFTGEALVAVLEDGSIARWQVAGDTLVAAPIIVTASPCKEAAITSDGAWLLLGAGNGEVRLVAADGSVQRLGTHTGRVRAVAFSPDGRRIATGGDDATVHVWDLARHRFHTLRGHEQRVRTLAFTPDGATLLSGDGGGHVRRWQLDRIPPTVLDHTSEVVALAVTHRSVLTSDATGALWRWDLETGGRIRLGDHGAPIVALGESGTRAASVDRAGTVRWWTERGPGAHREVVDATEIAITPSGDITAVAAKTGSISVFTDDGIPTATLSGHAGGTDAIAFSPDETYLASGGQDRVVRVWRVGAWSTRPQELGPLPDDTRQVAFARDGSVLLAAGDDGAVRAWQVGSAGVAADRAQIVATRHGGVIAFVSDGRDRVVLVGRDRTRVVLDLATGTTHELPGVVSQSDGKLHREVPIPVPAAQGGTSPKARVVTVVADGTAVLVQPARARSFADLQATLGQR